MPALDRNIENPYSTANQQRIEGMVGNNFSSYVRDYDFSVLLLEHNKHQPAFSTPDNFGELHGNLFKCFVNSQTYKSTSTNHRLSA
jgi:hypothetical protein